MVEYENEKKIILNEIEYNALKEHGYCCGEEKTQINYYYDTDDFELNRLGITCRIREKSGEYIATVKEHRNDKESSVEISEVVGSQYDDSFFKKMNIYLQGSLKTVRITSQPFSNIKIMLDRNEYMGIMDYELEIEFMPQKENLAVCIIETFANYLYFEGIIQDVSEFIRRTGKTLNKSQRFFLKKAYQKTKCY